jgi:hypothetical protein
LAIFSAPWIAKYTFVSAIPLRYTKFVNLARWS